MTIRVVLADDQTLIRAGFRLLLDAAPDLTVVGEASDGQQAVDVVRSTRADIVLMDIRMPGIDGIEATRRITSDEDLAGVKVIILTTFEIDQHVLDAIRAGASGFLGKGVEPADLLDAIRVVADGEALLSPQATRAMLTAFAHETSERGASTASDEPHALLELLTDREREVMKLAALGLTNDDIAERLYLSPLTAKTHANRAMMKLNARDRAQLVVLAYQTGLVRPGEQLTPR
jgi:DNA-binding NarL/FixJ family response regulator